MRTWIVAMLLATELVVTCAIFACSLQLSDRIARSRTVGLLASTIVRSTRRLAENGVRVRITIDNA